MIASSRAGARATCRALLMTTTLAATVACNDFPRTNPFDEGAKVDLVLTGPDSVTAIGDTVTFEVKTVQGESLDQIASWSVPDFLRSTGLRNQFVAIRAASNTRSTGKVEVVVNSNAVSKPFVYAQQVRGLSVSECGGGNKVITFTSFLAPSDPTYDAAAVCSALVDRRGNPVPDGSTVSTFTGVIRDTAIVRFVSPDQARLNALSIGSTYVVYTRAGFVDSLRVDVQQVLGGYQPNPSACRDLPGVVLAPGQTAQVSAIPSDAHGNPLVDTVAARAALVGMRWSREPALNVTISSSGLVKAVGQSIGWIFPLDRSNQVMFYCYVTVT